MYKVGTKVKFNHWLFKTSIIEGVVEDIFTYDSTQGLQVKSTVDTVDKPGSFYSIPLNLPTLQVIE